MTIKKLLTYQNKLYTILFITTAWLTVSTSFWRYWNSNIWIEKIGLFPKKSLRFLFLFSLNLCTKRDLRSRYMHVIAWIHAPIWGRHRWSHENDNRAAQNYYKFLILLLISPFPVWYNRFFVLTLRLWPLGWNCNVPFVIDSSGIPLSGIMPKLQITSSIAVRRMWFSPWMRHPNTREVVEKQKGVFN